MATYAQFDVRKTEAYGEGRQAHRAGMVMSDSDRCPYRMGSSSDRQGWMTGFFDAYFQRLCDKHNWGPW